ncbi:hypothetical protein ABKN59_009358 [Abortiporus biennis]
MLDEGISLFMVNDTPCYLHLPLMASSISRSKIGHSLEMIFDNLSNLFSIIVENHGMRLLYLPAYSPDLNPIKEVFSAIKSWVRTNRDYVTDMMEQGDESPLVLIWQAVHSVVTPEKAWGWFHHSQYVA